MTRFVKSRTKHAHLDFVSWEQGDDFSTEATRAEDLVMLMSADDRMIFADIKPDTFKTVGGFTYHHIT